MKGRLVFLQIVTILAVFCAGTEVVTAQRIAVDSLVTRGDSLRMAYRFEESLSAYNEALTMLQDTTATVEDSLFSIEISDKVLLSENGRNMVDYVYTPRVLARHTFSIDDFFLYYPLGDSTWHPVPNQLDSLSGPYSRAVYVPQDAETIFFSAPDMNGIRNIYSTSLSDTLWSVPSLLNEDMTSVSDEIYPMLSPDGKSLYFASKGLYGVGGYDIYVSRWDEESKDWASPVNMGFPYSSPANDFLMVESSDGKYLIFASDRDTSADSVNVYVIEKESVPVRGSIPDPDELRNLSYLHPASEMDNIGKQEDVKSDIPENVDTRRYMDKMAHVRALRDTLAACESSISHLRERYAAVENEEEKSALAEQILDSESTLPSVQARLEQAIKQLQDIEMDFLFSGVVIDPDKLLVEAEREVVGESTGYVFSKMNMGGALSLQMEQPEPEFDYTFKILDQAQVLRDTVSRNGIVYQIQVMSSDRPATVRSLKGLSPVFESLSPGGRYIYRVGLFHEYKDVLPHLNTVKRLGFRSAYIVAMVDGVEKKVAVVRNIENERKVAKPRLFRVVVPAGSELDSVVLTSLKQQAGERDIARTEDSLIIGPFEGEDAAKEFVDFVAAMGYGPTQIEEINN
jgi:hypothetical protein